MSAKPKVYLYLVHQETGQRYPVGEEVVIGRNAGDICFPNDIKMSGQHCRIVKTAHGPGLHDLESANGTWLDGVKLNPKKMYTLKPGATLTVANQIFKTLAPSIAKKVKPKRRKAKKQKGPDLVNWCVGVLAVCMLAFVAYTYINPAPQKTGEFTGQIQTPFEMVEKEMKAALNEYADLGRDHTAKRISDKDLSDGIRNNLIPKLTAAQAKLSILKPQNEFEKRKIAANDKLLTALLKQVGVIALFAVTQDQKLTPEMARLGSLAEQANRDLEKVEASRAPARYDY